MLLIMILAFLAAVVALLAYFCFIFGTIMSGDPTYKDMLSMHTMDMKAAIPAARSYMGYTVTMLTLFLFQLTTCATSIKFQINSYLAYAILASIFANIVLSVIFYFKSDEPVRTIPFLTFWTSLGMVSVCARPSQ